MSLAETDQETASPLSPTHGWLLLAMEARQAVILEVDGRVMATGSINAVTPEPDPTVVIASGDQGRSIRIPPAATLEDGGLVWRSAVMENCVLRPAADGEEEQTSSFHQLIGQNVIVREGAHVRTGTVTEVWSDRDGALIHLNDGGPVVIVPRGTMFDGHSATWRVASTKWSITRK